MQAIVSFSELTEPIYNELMDDLKGLRFMATFQAIANQYEGVLRTREDGYDRLDKCFVIAFGKFPYIILKYDKASNLDPKIHDSVVDSYTEIFGDNGIYKES